MFHGAGACLLAGVWAAGAAVAQSSELYISQHNSPRMVVLHGGVVVRSWDTVHAGENALAISGTIRTLANRWSDNGADGAEYDLAGNPLGPTYAAPAAGNWFDGTTDGRYWNYAVQHNGDYILYRFKRDWSTPEAMFEVGRYTSGIAIDPADRTFWVSDGLTGIVRHLDRAGNVLSSFDAAERSYAYGLAMDPADRTLWVGGAGSNVIYQYDTDGHLLSSVAVEGVGAAFGMEFDLPPLPCAGDFDANGAIDTRDLIAFLNAWVAGAPEADCDGNAALDSRDLICYLNAWNEGC